MVNLRSCRSLGLGDRKGSRLNKRVPVSPSSFDVYATLLVHDVMLFHDINDIHPSIHPLPTFPFVLPAFPYALN